MNGRVDFSFVVNIVKNFTLKFQEIFSALIPTKISSTLKIIVFNFPKKNIIQSFTIFEPKIYEFSTVPKEKLKEKCEKISESP